MHHIDTPNILDNWEASAPTSAEAFAFAKQSKLDAISKIDNPELKKLAKAEFQELDALEKQKTSEQLWIQNAHIEFTSDMDAIVMMDNKFSQLEGFETFTNYLTSWSLSSNELEHFYGFLKQKWPKAFREFRKSGFPTTRKSYAVFAEKFWIPTSLNLENKQSELDTQNTELYLNSLPALKSISDVPQVAELSKMIAELENLQGAEAQNQMLAISTYLVWSDGESWELDTILTALKEKDAENTANGNPSKHFEIFTRTVRDFSPDVSRRIDIFVASYNAESANNEPSISPYQKWLIEGAIPQGSKLQVDKHGIFTATTPEGDIVQITKEGDHLSRSYALNGSEFALQTPLIHSDFTKAQSEYETINQSLSPKLQKTENALSFLENPAYADVPLADMHEGLRKTLGYTQYEALGIQNISDKSELITLLKNNASEFKQELTDAKRVYEKAIQTAVTENRRHNAESDEKIKTTLKALRNSGLEFLDIDFLITNIKAGFITPDIWVPFDRQNLDLASGNFWETLSDTNNPTKHIEYIYRIANKVLTWSSDGIVDDKLIGFSLDQAIRNPDVPQKTDADVKHLLKQSGVWSETMGVDKVKVWESISSIVM